MESSVSSVIFMLIVKVVNGLHLSLVRVFNTRIMQLSSEFVNVPYILYFCRISTVSELKLGKYGRNGCRYHGICPDIAGELATSEPE